MILLTSVPLGLLVGASIVALGLELIGRPLVLPSLRRRPRGPRRLSPAVQRAVVIGVFAGLVTRWPIAVVGIGALAHVLGQVLTARSRAKTDIARTRAIARWVAALRNSIRPGNSLAASVRATARTVDSPIAPAVSTFADRCNRGEFAAGCTELARNLDHHMGDLLITALRVAHDKGAGRVSEALNSVAEAAESEARMMEEVEAERGSVNSDVRGIVVILGLAFLGLSFTDFGNSYRNASGQMMLLVVLCVSGAALVWMRTLSEYRRPERFFATRPGEEGVA